MHELSLCQNIVELMELEAKRQNFLSVKEVYLEIGSLACVEIEAMRFAFDAAVKGSVAEGAMLKMIEVEAMGYCRGCNLRQKIVFRYDSCSVCANYPLEIVEGEQMKIRHLEVC
ncbi:MAG: hydrogenase maturation nickel metallochaperone HypA [Zetaproteobacteria bacterium]|nr:hydrogenase maturation nickel metallochaperone HypA [Zetaproteobacteria bacterium]